MKILYIKTLFIILMLPLVVNTQDFDNNFLESLPAEVRAGILEENNQKATL